MSLYSTDTASSLGAGQRTGLGALLDEDLRALVSGYKRNIASRYRSLTPDEPELIPSGPLFASPKIDGELWFLVLRDGELALVNPRGRVMFGDLPLLVEARETLGKRATGSVVLAGELFAARKAGRPRVGDVAAAVSDNAPERLGFAAFDVLQTDGADAYGMPYEERLRLLREWLEGGKRTAAIKTEIVNDRENALRLFGEWAAEGKGEGIILRPTDGRIFKLKPYVTLDAAVIGFTVRADAPEQARSLLLALMRENGQLQLIGSCGNLGEEEQRRVLYTRLASTVVSSNYRYASSSGALFRFVRPELV
ncbi:MAG: ATP-dependent DNA ligase, partial [Deltaproteobacteria bacterium]|nr:ATP-dependent DNA ligase [Deltaproteobacteria bacterium]